MIILNYLAIHHLLIIFLYSGYTGNKILKIKILNIANVLIENTGTNKLFKNTTIEYLIIRDNGIKTIEFSTTNLVVTKK